MTELKDIARRIGVLVVEDQEAMREVIVSVLQNMGIRRIERARDGREALVILRQAFQNAGPGEHPFHLVITDWKMPIMNGLELLNEARRLPRVRELPFLFITSNNDLESVLTARSAGVADFISKPFHAKVLEEKLLIIFKSLPGNL